MAPSIAGGNWWAVRFIRECRSGAEVGAVTFQENLEHLKWRKSHGQIISRSIKLLPLHRRPHGLRRQHAAHGVRDAKGPQPPALEDVRSERRHIVRPRPSRRLAGADGPVEPRQELCRSSIDALVDRPAHAAPPLEQRPAPGPVWKSTSASSAPRHRAGVASMAWRSTCRFSANAP